MDILVVDDDGCILDLLCDMLVRLGHVPNPCQNPKQALLEFRQAAQNNKPFKLVITDFQMPVWSGLTLALSIKACCHAFEINCPVICITGEDSEAQRMNCRDGSPIHHFMQKGFFGQQDLDAVIKQLTSA